MTTHHPAYVLLEDGAWFQGTARRSFSATPGEVVFTTNLSGYQEVFTDPSYLGQIVVMTAPMIGNYGINEEDLESGQPQVRAVVVRELSREYSNWRASGALDEWLAGRGIPAIEGVDTRRLARHIRSAGAMRGIVSLGEAPCDEVRAQLEASPHMLGLDLASLATVDAERGVGGQDADHHVVAFDFGMKRNILRILTSLGCRVTVVPATTPAARVRELAPDGLFLSNGPGDPAAVRYALPVIRELAESGLPTFGICLGHQLVSLAFGGETAKLPYGHRGGNHPVREFDSGRVLITTQNHGFAVKGSSKTVSGAKGLEVTHRNLNDDTIEGVRHRELPLFAVQYHPEASPGPHDARGHFYEFVQALDSQQVSRY
ncbi:MAG: glutamine-hydrolyzing carbamoyl-phosphate synthase small subunit [Gemmatimonadales bacterium]|nr:glutamine-hydrolyzing carbamoyl-phosphate synthase small subunit [Gemmatimonadales bacterium]NIN50151.1 glutamine-hydrolyzing carbamoyl-phosphate synthase small subunit [Gemmatimonadales bacterium]NIP07615.1 glutamine-hydrolyzing carbamoyl-phosphate synthase small subunit [Gemmatimonadales bacterium]NIR01767.1 glutamine-hydrolyzing carbamoyl-phosphate synthase small subunit [Gemmatimonadales bacterium]NIS65670.1 glutamine-hydrolyzing carbamoyl-phosphate synthase small subunit [Gemmatimonadal